MKPETFEHASERQRSIVAAAEAAGLMAGVNGALGARVPRELIMRAKQRSGITSTTDLIEYALAKVALEDDFGVKLVNLKGTVPADLALEL